MKKTLILGATTNKDRYAFKAADKLTKAGHPIVPFGVKKGVVFGKEIINKWQDFEEIDTVTLYIGPTKQNEYFDKIVALKPKRVLFNPGTENPEFELLLINAEIKFEAACTLILLSINQY